MRRDKTLRMIERYCKGKVLDLGCGTGSVTEYLFRKGFDVEGCDFDEGRISIAKKKNPKINYFLFDLDKQELKKKYDTIVLMGVLEGLNSKPSEVLMRLKKNLNVGGRIIFEVPNTNSLQNRIRSLFGMEPLDEMFPKTYRFTKKRVFGVIRAARFKPVKITTTGFVQIRGKNIPMIDSMAQEFFAVIEGGQEK
jgi:2-polyprenyl-3-methyl-5-hydroxy-6-metoxy-1,4-benzoquinol methylase